MKNRSTMVRRRLMQPMCLTPRLSRALSIFDVPQDLTVSYTVQMPFDRLTGGAAKRLTAGWALSGIATFAKGEPVQISETDDNSLSGTFDATIDEPKVVPATGPLFVNRNPRNHAGPVEPLPISTQITSLPNQLGQVGNAMRRFFSGPGINNFDMALLKDTRITERHAGAVPRRGVQCLQSCPVHEPVGKYQQLRTGRFRVCDWRPRSPHHATRVKVFVLGRISPMLPSPRSQSVLVLAALWAASCFAAWPQTPQQALAEKGASPLSTRGKQTFASTCARCHGLDGQRRRTRSQHRRQSKGAAPLRCADRAHH